MPRRDDRGRTARLRLRSKLQRLDDLIKDAENDEKETKNEKDEQDTEIERLETAVNMLEEAAGDPGPYERALEEYLQSISVARQAYYSGAFVGNHEDEKVNEEENAEKIKEAKNTLVPVFIKSGRCSTGLDRTRLYLSFRMLRPLL